MDSSVTRDDVSRDGQTLGELDQQEQDHTQDGERHDAGEKEPGIHAAVRHHEEITEASVTADAGVYTLSVHDLTSGKSFTVTKACSTCLNSSAGVTAGSPSGVAPADFGVVHFTSIVVIDGGGVTGGLANAAWNTDKLTQPGSPHTVAGPLHTFSSPAHSTFADTRAP